MNKKRIWCINSKFVKFDLDSLNLELSWVDLLKLKFDLV